ncbi:peptide ligase PGM1-related protein [Streptomyces sp. NPDC047097]|uniref:preATP grasp domain-containing protein n=1 Tax=Streptomyces sp. NPDC047097 TaxID=3155260 RepID=UPI0033D27AA5
MTDRTVEDRGPALVYANFVSDLAVGLGAGEVLERWAEQAPRKVWLLRPGDVLLTPVPVDREFRGYAARLLGLPLEELAAVVVPPLAGASMADAVRAAGLLGTVRELVRHRPGLGLLPTALDESSVLLARELGLPVIPYGEPGPTARALRAASVLNTKSGFREAARELGIRVPEGGVCDQAGLRSLAARMVAAYGEVVVKPDRSAGGHGLVFHSAASPALPAAGPGLEGGWVVEERVDVAHSVSVQLDTGPRGCAVVYSGEMRVEHGAFTGYESPLHGPAAAARAELEEWGLRLGGLLAREGYAGPFSVDAVVTRDGTLFANESNVRRTATTTPHAMIARLVREAGREETDWLVGRHRSARPYAFGEVVRLLEERGLAWDPGRGEGVVLYMGGPADGRSWRYAVAGGSRERTAELEARLASALAFEG